jgi:hypothetical protein
MTMNLQMSKSAIARCAGSIPFFTADPGAYAPDRGPRPSTSAGVEVFMPPSAPQTVIGADDAYYPSRRTND